jgi:lipoate-protein ligase A
MPPLAPRWRVLDSGAADGATNMATDVALMERAAAAGEAVLRVYAWSAPTVSFGLNERARLSPSQVAEAGLDAVRRPTGGRALLHHREVTYSVTAPAGAASLGESYRAINAILVLALAALGVRAVPAPRGRRATAPDGAACFAEPAAGELVVGGQKLVGSAQRRDAHALLQHGSILLDDDQGLLGAPGAASLHALLGRSVGYSAVRDALVDALATALGADPAAVLPLDPAELAGAVREARARFADPRWTWRR